MDGYSPETGWIKIDAKALASDSISAFEKRAKEDIKVEEGEKDPYKVQQEREI